MRAIHCDHETAVLRVARALGSGLLLAAAALAVACGSDGGGTDPGGGTITLQVEGDFEYGRGDQATDLSVRVRRDGVDVTDATVVVSNDLGELTLVHAGGGDYVGVQPGWGSYYALRVTAGEDSLHGSIDAPALVDITSPDATVALDPQTADGGVVIVRWSGDLAEEIWVKTKDFDYRGEDKGRLEIPATVFQDNDQDLEVGRQNRVVLAGGVAGSRLSAECDDKVTLIVVNPF